MLFGKRTELLSSLQQFRRLWRMCVAHAFGGHRAFFLGGLAVCAKESLPEACHPMVNQFAAKHCLQSGCHVQVAFAPRAQSLDDFCDLFIAQDAAHPSKEHILVR